MASEVPNEIVEARILTALGYCFTVILLLVALLFSLSGAAHLSPGAAVTAAFVFPPVVRRLRQAFPVLRTLGLVGILGAAAFVVFTITAMRFHGRPASYVSQSDPARQAASEVPRDSVITEVQGLIAKGTEASTTAAMNRMNDAFGLELINSDPELKALYSRATRAADASSASDQAVSYAEKVEGHWLKDLNALPPQADIASIFQRLNTFDEAARRVDDGRAFLSDGAAARARQKLKMTLVGRQRAELPALRRAYAKALRNKLWEQDAEVFAEGAQAKSVLFVAAIFATNRNIASVQNGAEQNLRRLRFDSSRYEWYRGSQSWKYELDVPEDGVVGYWVDGTFKRVD